MGQMSKTQQFGPISNAPVLRSGPVAVPGSKTFTVTDSLSLAPVLGTKALRESVGSPCAKAHGKNPKTLGVLHTVNSIRQNSAGIQCVCRGPFFGHTVKFLLCVFSGPR